MTFIVVNELMAWEGVRFSSQWAREREEECDDDELMNAGCISLFFLLVGQENEQRDFHMNELMNVAWVLSALNLSGRENEERNVMMNELMTVACIAPFFLYWAR